MPLDLPPQSTQEVVTQKLNQNQEDRETFVVTPQIFENMKSADDLRLVLDKLISVNGEVINTLKSLIEVTKIRIKELKKPLGGGRLGRQEKTAEIELIKNAINQLETNLFFYRFKSKSLKVENKFLVDILNSKTRHIGTGKFIKFLVELQRKREQEVVELNELMQDLLKTYY